MKTKISGITLNFTARQKVNPEVIRDLVHAYALDNEARHVTVDIPYKITRNTKTKSIEGKRMKKDYRIVYDKRIIIEDYKTSPYGF